MNNINLRTLKAPLAFFISKIFIKNKDIGSDKITYLGFNGMLHRNRSKSLLRLIVKLSVVVIGKISPQWERRIFHLVKWIIKTHEHQGLVGTVKVLKANSVVLQQVIAKHHIYDMTPLGVRVARTGGGIPRCLPSDWRHLIRQGDPASIRMALTVFALYREITVPAKPKLQTITDKPYVDLDPIMAKMVPFIGTFWNHFLKGKPFKMEEIKLFPISKSSPHTRLNENSTHPEALFRSICQLKSNHPELLTQLITYINYTDKSFLSKPFIRLVQEIDPWFVNFNKGIPHSPMGKLGFKHEAAGKMRVFAMVDPITQWVMRPLHDALFKVLRRHRTDGTFNQLRPLSGLPWGEVPVYSFDLSAATDRLPIIIQEKLLAHLIGDLAASAWVKILVGRTYLNRLDKSELVYGTGQPMGALSSWAMLAITHHFIVHFVAFKIGLKAPGCYAILGDDIIIWNKGLAKGYLEVTKALGLEINLSKSVLSPEGDGAEFAKRTFFQGQDVSPVPVSEFRAATRHPASAKEFMIKHSLSFIKLLKAFDWGWRVTSNLYSYANLPKNSRLLHLWRAIHFPANGIEFVNTLIADFLPRHPYLAPNFNWEEISVHLDTKELALYVLDRVAIAQERSEKLQNQIEDLLQFIVDNDPYNRQWDGVEIFGYGEAIDHWKATLKYYVLTSTDRVKSIKELRSDLDIFFDSLGPIVLDVLMCTPWSTGGGPITSRPPEHHLDYDYWCNVFNQIEKFERDIALIAMIMTQRVDDKPDSLEVTQVQVNKIKTFYDSLDKWKRIESL